MLPSFILHRLHNLGSILCVVTHEYFLPYFDRYISGQSTMLLVTTDKKKGVVEKVVLHYQHKPT